MDEHVPIQLANLSDAPAAQLGSRVQLPPDEDGVETRPLAGSFSLPPVDGGKDAWFFLAAAFMIEALVWGFAFSFGVFQDYYSSHEPFAGSNSIAIIGTCSMGIMYLNLPVVFILTRIFPSWGRWAPPVGLLIMCFALALSSFSSTVEHLIVTQGVFYAIGGSICYGPCIIYLDEWFIKRKGFAYGIMWSGTGLAGVVLPLVSEYLLTTYGVKTALRVFSVVLFVLTAPLAFFIKPRLPVSAAMRFRPFSLRFLFTRTFGLYQLANIVEALGFFMPGLYLPSYARVALGASPFASALTVLLVNVASVFGCIAMGSLTDRLPVTTCLLISTAGATVGTLVFWGMAASLPLLYVFSLVYGLFAGSFSSTWPGIMREVATNFQQRESSRPWPGSSSTVHTEAGRAVDPVMTFGFLSAGRGVGNIVSGPLSGVLVRGMPWQGQAAGGYGTGYGSLIVFTGVTALFGGASFLWKRIGWL